MTTPAIQLLPGDFAVVRKQGNYEWRRDRIKLLLWLAQFADGSTPQDDLFYHAFIYVGDNEIIEAEPSGAQRSPLSKYDPASLLWSTGLISLTEAERNTIVAYAESWVGTPYGWKTYLALAAYRFHIRTKWVRDTLASHREMICSQYIDACYAMAPYQLFPGSLPGSATPAKLAGLLRRLAADHVKAVNQAWLTKSQTRSTSETGLLP